MNNNDNGFDINSIINGTPSNTVNNTPNNNQAQPANQVPFTTGVAESVPAANTDGVNNMTAPDDPNAMVNEKLKKVEIDYKPPGKYQMFLLIVFFFFIIGFAFFLPEISSFINLYKSGKLNEVNEEITTGKITCKLESNTANLDMSYVRVFYFEEKMLRSAEFTLTTRGDPTQDEKTLDALNLKCTTLSEHSKAVNGLNVKCEYDGSKLVETQTYKYASINEDEINAAFAEIGGTVPEFSDGEDIDKIEHSMNAAGYSCFKEK